MTENKCKSLENLLPIATAKLLPRQSPIHFETYRNELHREMTKHWPVRINTSNSMNIALTTSKSTAYSSIRDGNKSNLTVDSNDILHLRSKNLPVSNSIKLNEKKSKIKNRIISIESEFSLIEPQQRNEWNIKAREGIIKYRLPDGLPDGFALHTKLEKLMKTDTIYLNDRHFWRKLENRFQKLRKENLQQNMEHLRQTQQQYEQELISKGILPYTTEEAIKQYAEQQQQRTQIKTDKIDVNKINRKNCLIDYISLNDTDILNTKNDELEAFESDNVHPCLDEIFTDYQFQTKSKQEMGKKFENNLHKAQMQIKTIFPKKNPRDSIRQELEAVKTSEGLYAYSNRLTKRTTK